MKKVELRVGVEIETQISGTFHKMTSIIKAFEEWKVHSESSIPGSGGWEFVSPRLSPKRLKEVNEVIKALEDAGGSFPEATNTPRSLEEAEEQEGVYELLPLLAQAQERERLNPGYEPGPEDPLRSIETYEGWIKSRKKLAKKSWENIQRYGPCREDRAECCSMHIHIGTKTCKSKRLNRKFKGIVRAIYSFYYQEFIEPNLPLCRREGGTASNWSQVQHPGNEEFLYLDKKYTECGSRYLAVNTTSEHKTIEFRQPSIGPTSKLDADGWIELCSTIYKAGWYFFHLKNSPDTVGALKARLPNDLDGLRKWITQIEEDPSKYLEKEPPKPVKRTKKVNEELTDTFISPEALEKMLKRKIATVYVEKC